jgi:hypothetical protein
MKHLLLVLAAIAAAAAGAQELQKSWTLNIENLEHKEVASLTIQFTDEPARSCMAGTWKRVLVTQSRTNDKSFFPISESLSYQIKDGQIIIGRNEVCDDYLHLNGKFNAEGSQGRYVEFGIQGGNQLGYFVLKPNH